MPRLLCTSFLRRRGPAAPGAIFPALALLLASPLAAQNLIDDGDFDGTLGSWFTTGVGATLTLGSNDAASCAPDSDSARAENSAAGASTQYVFVHACISPIVGGSTYSFGGYIRFITGQTATGSATFSVSPVSGLNCSGVAAETYYSQPFITSVLPGNWFPSVLAFDAPEEAQSVALVFRLLKDPAGDSLAARFDEVFFAHGDLIFDDNFEIARSCHWTETSPP